MEAAPLIAIFCNSFPPEGGAAAQRMHHLAVLLRDAGYRVEVVSSMPNYPRGRVYPGYRGALQRIDSVDGIPVQRCWLFPSNSAAALPRALNLLSQAASFRILAFRRILRLQPALVIVSSPPLPMAAAAISYFSKAAIPALLNVSDLWPLSARVLGATSESWIYRRLQDLERRMYCQATAISAQSETILEHIAGAGIPAKPQFLLRNLPASAAAPRATTPNSFGGSLRIIYPGLLGHAQGLLALLAAIDWRALGAELHLYGEGGEADGIRNWLRAHPEQPVQLFQPVGNAALQAAFPGYDAVLVPLLSEIPGAVPSKLFTAVHAGLPVLYSAGGEGATLVRKHHLGYVSAPGDYPALADSILKLKHLDSEARQAWQAAILATARRYFRREVQDEALLQFVGGLLA